MESFAVVERFFQTICGSWPSDAARASTTRALVPGLPAWPAGTVPTAHEIVPSGLSAPGTEALVKVAPAGGATVTVPPSRAAWKFSTRTVKG